MSSFKILILNITFSFIFASKNLIIKPITFIDYVSEGNDYIIKDSPITIFGIGLKSSYKNNQWLVDTEYIQLGLFGDIDKTIFNFSPKQSFPYLDNSKDANGYWSEFATAKVRYISNNFEINFGKFDRQWGFGKRFLHISDKPPSYPQFGFKWDINENFKLIYFHGFLNSGISDTNRSIFYNNKRSLKISRNIAAHRIEWKLAKNIIIGLNESVIYATRVLDPHYLIPITLFYPIENYLGDTDNLQMGCDAIYSFNKKNKFYFGFFMDELTPEWIFNSKNHNWFAWQFGYSANNILFDDETIFIEYNWTDQRIYKHKFVINDYYSHNQPLGFWAGPHAQEFLIYYTLSFKNNKISLKYSNVKRGLSAREMVEDNYADNQADRFEYGSEIKNLFTMFLERSSKVNDLYYRIGLNYVKFINVGFNISEIGLSNEKFSLNIGIYYNIIN